jgi:predicted nucleic acid-binding Zn ribbon protein
MFKLFKKQCPVCKMELKENYVEGFGNKFCSEECREIFRKKLAEEQSKSNSCGCC